MEQHGAMIERSILFDSMQDFPMFLVNLCEVNIFGRYLHVLVNFLPLLCYINLLVTPFCLKLCIVICLVLT
jgi:hypothetical protein